MGNCIDRQRAASWAEDDDVCDDDERAWASSEESVNSQEDDEIEKNGRDTSSGGTTTTTEVKIKITKKQLEKLLKQVDGKDLTIQEVLADLMSSEVDTGRHWKPALQSIPEASE